MKRDGVVFAQTDVAALKPDDLMPYLKSDPEIHQLMNKLAIVR